MYKEYRLIKYKNAEDKDCYKIGYVLFENDRPVVYEWIKEDTFDSISISEIGDVLLRMQHAIKKPVIELCYLPDKIKLKFELDQKNINKNN
jgi:hypothetical protein